MQIQQYIRNFETSVASRDWPQAYGTLTRLLREFSQEDERFVNWCHAAARAELTAIFTRFAAAATDLLMEPASQLLPQDFRQLTSLAPQLAHVFLLSGFGNADHIVSEIAARGKKSADDELIFADSSDARKYLLCSFIYGRSVEQIISMVRRAPQPALSSVLASLAAHVTCTSSAQENRNQLLDALEIARDATPSSMAMADLHSAWTLCSYATTEHRHRVKKHLNQMILNWLSAQQVVQPAPRVLATKDRPTLLVACEVTGGGHVMSRCYEPFLEQLRQRFRVVTMVAETDLGDETVPWADELILFKWRQDKFAEVLETINSVNPDIIYYPCIGMRLWTLVACNLRLAPLQIASLGHPATTNSSQIDYIVGGATTSGSDACYSEQLVRLKSPGNLYRFNRGQESYPREIRSRPAPLRIAVCANMLKLNAVFIDACAAIVDRAERSVEFCFMPNCIGLKYLVARQQVTTRLAQRARFRVIPRQRCADYLQNLGICDIYLSPFPFGGENSTLDALLQGLPAVTLMGEEPHSCLDARVLETAALPSWLIAKSIDEYIDATVRLINEDETRIAITRQLLDSDLERQFSLEHELYTNDFVDSFWSIYESALAKRDG